MANNFKDCIKELIDIEGEWANNPADKGKRTRWGISEFYHPEINLDTLTAEERDQFYWNEFWLKMRLDQVIDNAVAYEIFEEAVNSGQGGAVKIVQESLNYLGEQLDVDGGMGGKTLTAINYWAKREPRILLKVLNGVQFAHFLEIVKTNPSQKAFAKGWMKRIEF